MPATVPVDIDVLADAEHEEALARESGSDKLDNLKRLAARQVALEDEIEALQRQLDNRRKELVQLSQTDLPFAFNALGLTHIGIGNVEVRLEHGLDAKLWSAERSPEKRRYALDWLTLNNLDGIIKVSLEVRFGRNEWKLAQAIAEDIQREFKLPVAINETVHPGTYKKQFKELILDQHRIIPEAADLGVYQYNYTVVIR